nr:cytochrome P450 [Agasicles hygrophila]
MIELLWVFLILTIIYLYIQRQKRYEEYWKHIMAIPGPKSVPILGTNYVRHTSESLFLRDRQRTQELYPIYKMWSFNVASVNLMSPEDMELILNNQTHIEKGLLYSFLHQWLGTGLLTNTGKSWHQRRKILTPAFHFSILREFMDMLNNETEILVTNLRKLSDQPYVDVTKPITEFTLYSIGETSMGVQLRNEPNCGVYKKAIYDIGEAFIYRIVRPWLYVPFVYSLSPAGKSYSEIVKTLHNFSNNLISERKKLFQKEKEQKGSYSQRKRLALLDLMLQAKENGADIDDDGIRQEVDTFVFEGHDTTAVCLCYTLMVLANEQSIQDEMYQEIISVLVDPKKPTFNDLGELKFMERCIKESLRLYPSVPIISRVLAENITTRTGYIIPKGCNVNLLFFDMHRRPEIWEDPEKFDPDRFLPSNAAKRHPYSYLPFSAGSRNCIGQKFAMLELKTALCGILKNFKLEPVDTPADMRYKLDLVLRPLGEIRVKFVPR